MDHIPLAKPFFPSPPVLPQVHLVEGPLTKEAEGLLGALHGYPHVVLVPNCTIGLELALRAQGRVPTVVVLPALTHPATAWAALRARCGIILEDVDEATWLLPQGHFTDQDDLLPVSLFGNSLEQPCGVVEDAAGGVFSALRADTAVLSFHPRKPLTCGEGGAVLTRSAEVAGKLRSMKSFTPTPGNLSGNFRFNDILAAILLPQLHHYAELRTRRQEQVQLYTDLLKGTFPVQRQTPGTVLQTFCVEIQNRDAVIAVLRQRGIETQVGTYNIAAMPPFAASRHINCRNAERLARTLLALPLFHELTPAQQRRVVKELKDATLRA